MENVNKTQLGDRIRELRTAAGHTQDDLAALLDKHRQVVSYYENGTRTPNLNELITIAKEYNTTTDYLLGLSDTATTDTDIKAICDYTGLSEESINILYDFNKNDFIDILEFANELVIYLKDNQFDILQFFSFKKMLYNTDKVLNENVKRVRANNDSMFFDLKKYDELWEYVMHWKNGNELYFQTSQFRLSSAFDKIINGNEIVRCTGRINCVYNSNEQSKENEQ